MSIRLEHSTPIAAPFDAIAEAYDDVFSNSAIGRAQRRAVWSEMDREFHAGQSVLEINCGTGIDALHLAQRGVSVDACGERASWRTAVRKPRDTPVNAGPSPS